MSLPSENVHSLKRTREFLRSILSEPRRPQFALKAEASSCLRHYPHDYIIEDKWATETPTHECKCKGYYRKPDQTLIDLLVKIAKDEKTPKLRKGQIMEALKGVTIQGRESDWLYSNEDETNKEEV